MLFRRREFLAYLGFTLLITSYILIEGFGEFISSSTETEQLRKRLLHVSILLLGGVFYLQFVRYLIDAANNHFQLNRISIWTERIILLSVLISVPVIQSANNTRLALPVYALVYMIILPAQLYILYTMIRHFTVYTGLVIAGTILLMVSMRYTFLSWIFFGVFPEKSISQGIVMAGVSLNFLFMNLSLIFRSKEIQNEKIQLEIQKRDELNRQRMNISNDLHDDAGASLSSLYLYSTMAESAVGKDTQAAQKHLSRISKGLREVMENMNDIVWAVSRDDRNEKLFSSRIKDFAYELSDATGIDIHYHIDPELERLIKDVQVRRNLLLITKEALNNAMKHSGARQVTVSLHRNDDHLQLSVADDGCGFDPELSKSGHGLSTLKNRAESIGGKLSIDSSLQGKGTTITCTIPLARISD